MAGAAHTWQTQVGELVEAAPSPLEPPFARGLEECLAHTDLAWRLKQIPKHYAVRGVFMNMLDERAESLSPETQAAYRDFFGCVRFSPVRLYSVTDYLVRLVKLSQ